MHDAEAVADTNASASAASWSANSLALGVVLAGLAGVEPDVLQHRDVTVGEAGDDLLGRLPHRVGREGDVAAQQLAEPLGDRSQAVALLRLALGPAQVRGHDDPGAGLGQRLDRRQARPDPALVGDRGCRPGAR